MAKTKIRTIDQLDVTSSNAAGDSGLPDSNGEPILSFSTTAGSVINYLTVANAITATNPSIAGTGEDANIGIDLKPKAAGAVVIHNTVNDAAGAQLHLKNARSGAGSAGDDAGSIKFLSANAGDPVTYETFAEILAETVVVADGDEGGKLSLKVAAHDAGLEDGLVLTEGDVNGEVDVGIGSGAASLTTVKGSLLLTTVAAAGADTDKFLVLDSSGNVDYRSGSDVASDIGALSDGATLTSGLTFTGGTVDFNGSTITVDDSSFLIRAATADANGENIVFQKTRNATDGAHTIVQDNDVLGEIAFQGSDGDSFESAALIQAASDGTPGSGSDMPGRLVFSVSAESSATPAEAMRISNTGNITVGGGFDGGSKLHVQDGDISINSNAADAAGHSIILSHSRNATDGSHTIVQDNDVLGQVLFQGSDGSDYSPAAKIFARVNGTPGNNDMPGELVFSVTADDANAPTEAMRILQDKTVQIVGNLEVSGTTTQIDSTVLTVADPLIVLNKGDTTNPSKDQGIVFTRGNGSNTNIANKALIWDETADEFVFAASNTEAGTTAGNVTINSYAPLNVGTFKVGGAAGTGADAYFYTAGNAAHVGLHWDADLNTEGTLLGGVDGSGVDLKFWGESAGSYMHWDMAQDELVVANGEIRILDTSDGATAQALVFEKNSSDDSPADGDAIGSIDFKSRDSGDAEHTYAQIISRIGDVTGGSEEGKLEFLVAEVDGTMHATDSVAMSISGALTYDGGTNVDIAHDGLNYGLQLGGTAVTAVATELNLLAGKTSVAADDWVWSEAFSGAGTDVQSTGVENILYSFAAEADANDNGDLQVRAYLNGLRLRLYEFVAGLYAGTAISGGNTVVRLSTAASTADDFYNGMYVHIYEGTGIGQTRLITDYDQGTDTCTVAAWTTNPDNTSKYIVSGQGTAGGDTYDGHVIKNSGRSGSAKMEILLGEPITDTDTLLVDYRQV